MRLEGVEEGRAVGKIEIKKKRLLTIIIIMKATNKLEGGDSEKSLQATS